MKKTIYVLSALFLSYMASAQAQSPQQPTSGNPIFQGWYADPEAAIFDKTYWIYPTYSAKYNQQVFFDAFSSTDLIHWQKHARTFVTTAVRWAKRARWSP